MRGGRLLNIAVWRGGSCLRGTSGVIYHMGGSAVATLSCYFCACIDA